jgi:cytidylate kinase
MSEILIVSGASGTGKTTLSRLMARFLGARLVNVGDIVTASMRVHGISFRSRPEAGRLFLELFGEETLGSVLLRNVPATEKIVIDGLRVPAARAALSSHRHAIFHIHLDVSREIRECRLARRDGRIDRNNPADDLVQQLRRHADLILAERDFGRFIDALASRSHGVSAAVDGVR